MLKKSFILLLIVIIFLGLIYIYLNNKESVTSISPTSPPPPSGLTPPLSSATSFDEPINFESSLNPWKTVNVIIKGSTVTLKEHSAGTNSYLYADVTIPQGAELLSFDYKWLNMGDGDYLSVQYGVGNDTFPYTDGLLFNILGTWFEGSNFVNSDVVPISMFMGQTKRMLFTLNSVGKANSEVIIKNFMFSTYKSMENKK